MSSVNFDIHTAVRKEEFNGYLYSTLFFNSQQTFSPVNYPSEIQCKLDDVAEIYVGTVNTEKAAHRLLISLSHWQTKM